MKLVVAEECSKFIHGRARNKKDDVSCLGIDDVKKKEIRWGRRQHILLQFVVMGEMQFGLNKKFKTSITDQM